MFSRRYRYIFLLVATITLSFSQSNIVSATSPYDNAYKTTSSVYASGVSCSSQDITATYASYILDSSKWVHSASIMQPVKNSYENALENGRIGVSMRENYGQQQTSTVVREVFIYWNTDDSLELQWWGNANVSALVHNYVSITCLDNVAGGQGKIGVAAVNINNTNFTAPPVSNNLPDSFSPYAAVDRNLFVNSNVPNYPVGYEGGQILTSGSSADIDGDDLTASYEAMQGTSDSNMDSDGDGLNDYTESRWYPSRQTVFCGTSCAYPNPTSKDLYIEVDWMKNGNRTIKPSPTQLAAVTTSFAGQGIAAHFDTGQYGGGNELPVYANELYFEPDVNNLDFFDLKNGNSIYAANFNQDRDYIWHYMISGYKAKYWDTDSNQWITNSSGVAYAGDDDILIATGHIEDDQTSFNYNNLDTALSGTIIHEIGHSICLTKNAYTNQSVGCQFNKIDTWADPSYDSVMNYTHQMFQADYSNGANGSPDDHDDWTAVLNGGLKDFTDANHNSGDSAGMQSLGKKDKKEKVVRGITSSEAKALKKAGKLGGKYKSHDNKIR